MRYFNNIKSIYLRDVNEDLSKKEFIRYLSKDSYINIIEDQDKSLNKLREDLGDMANRCNRLQIEIRTGDVALAESNRPNILLLGLASLGVMLSLHYGYNALVKYNPDHLIAKVFIEKKEKEIKEEIK